MFQDYPNNSFEELLEKVSHITINDFVAVNINFYPNTTVIIIDDSLSPLESIDKNPVFQGAFSTMINDEKLKAYLTDPYYIKKFNMDFQLFNGAGIPMYVFTLGKEVE